MVMLPRIPRRLWLAPLAAFLLLGFFRPALALPVFARKHQTSCQTCHAIFPKLNPFGQAFRLNGYRLPAETEEQVKENPLSLGAEAYKRTWPSMVYPGTIPGHVPVAVNVKMADVYASSLTGTGRQILRNDFQLPQEVNLFTAGTLGDKFSFLGELTFAENPDGSSTVEVERVHFAANSAFGPEHAFNFKVGKFAPSLDDGFHEMGIMTDNAIDTLFGYSPVGFRGGTGPGGAGGISLPVNSKGMEMYGVAHHRFFYTVGVTNGLGPVTTTNGDHNSHKDFYARFDYKIGGLGLDGDTKGVTLPPENWREKSLRLGIFGYGGDGSDVNFAITDDSGNPFQMQDRRYERVGLFASWYFSDLNVFGVVLHGKDTLRLLDNATLAEIDETDRTYDVWFVQADYVIKPPFQASLRYENLRVADPTVDSIRIANLDFSYLARANIKLMLEYNRDLRESQNYTLAGILRFAF